MTLFIRGSIAAPFFQCAVSQNTASLQASTASLREKPEIAAILLWANACLATLAITSKSI